VVDENSGTRYSLNLVANEFRRESDGMTIVLPSDVADTVATAMAMLIQNDPSIESLESLSLPGTPGGGCTGMPGDPCAASVAPSGLGHPLIVKWAGSRRPLDRPGGVAGGGEGRGKHGSASPYSVMSPLTVPGIPMADLLAGDVCTNIINAALPQTIDYRGKRTSALDGVFQYGVNQGWNTATKNYLVKGSAAVIRFITVGAEVKMAGIAVGYLRGMWNDYRCGGSPVVAGPYYHPAAGGDYTAAAPGMAHDFRCATEEWNISWDDGHHYEKVKVTVCQFVS
jgi:hypothetical protein